MISRWPLRSGVTVHDGVAYFGAGIFPHEDVYLYAVNPRTGKIVWKRDDLSQKEAGRNPLSPQGYLLANNKYLVIPSGRALPATFDRKSGKLVHHRIHSWRREGVIGGTLGMLADGQIYAAGAHQMLAITQDKGDVGFGRFECEHMAIAGDAAFTIDGSTVRRIDRLVYAQASGKRQQARNVIYSLGRALQIGGGDRTKSLRKRLAEAKKTMTKLAKTGVVWETPLSSQSALVAAGNLVIAGGENRVDALDAKTGKQVWKAAVDGEARGLAVADGHLVVSTSKGKIYVFAGSKQPETKVASQESLVDNPYKKDAWTVIYEQAAENILDMSKQKRGFCLVVGCEEGRLAFELAKRSRLKIYCVDPRLEKVRQARLALTKTGLYGNRIVVHQADLSAIPYSDYFANLIVSDSFLRTGKVPGKLEDVYRHLRPLGGLICLGQPKDGKLTISAKEIRKQFEASLPADTGRIDTVASWVTFKRGKLEGAGSWTHQYGEPGNTASSTDQVIKGGLGVLWYGDPGPGKMVNRHEGAVGPLAVNGRLIVEGQNNVMAYDAYNGLFLWEHNNPDTFRTGVFQNVNPGNLCASDDSVFVMAGAKVVQLDLETGKPKRTHFLPPAKQKEHQWGYIAYRDGKLFGTATIRKELAERLRRRGRKFDDMTDAIFAIDVESGKHLWTYEGKKIAHQTIALGPNRVYFIDSSLSPEQRQDLINREKDLLQKLQGKDKEVAKERIRRLDVRLAVAVDAKTGEKLWSKPVDVTDCSEIGIGGGKLTLMFHDGTLVLCGANANGHYWRQFVAGEFKQRRLVVLSAKDGTKLWAKDANYRHRPIIVGERLIAEPWAFDLKTGKQQMRRHPLTGKQVPWSIIRPGHHCGMLTGCPNMLFFRSGYTGFYDLYNDDGTRHFAGHRLGCWINAIPANGLVMIPEASAGCVCQFSIASTITLQPRQPRRPWTIYSAVGNVTPVQRMALNFGAPGDRKDAFGNLWLAYPRPATRRETGLDLKLRLDEAFVDGGTFKSVSDQRRKVDGTDAPWLYTSWARGLTTCTLPLLGKGDAPAIYKVRLHFAD